MEIDLHLLFQIIFIKEKKMREINGLEDVCETALKGRERDGTDINETMMSIA